METEALELARRLVAAQQPERLSWQTVTLSVTDLKRASRFWRDVLGFIPRPGDGPGLALGTEERTLVVLVPGATAPVARGHAGLYHVAFGMPDQAEFSRRLQRLRDLAIPHSPVDHLMSKAIYLADPDGHGIEIAHETPERFGRFSLGHGGFALIDAAGRSHSGRERLDVARELARADGTDPGRPLRGDAIVAHIHLHVPDIDEALDWFEGVGFVRNLTLAAMGMADMGTGAPYTHRLAVNVWAGIGVLPAPPQSARLLSYSLVANDARSFAAAATRLNQAGDGGNLTGTDPAGVSLDLHPHPAFARTEHAA